MNQTGTPEQPPHAAEPKAQPAFAKPFTLRDKIVQATPAFIVNSSSNVIAGMHILAEALMLKASGIMFWQNTRNIGNELKEITAIKAQQRELIHEAQRIHIEKPEFTSLPEPSFLTTFLGLKDPRKDSLKAVEDAIKQTDKFTAFNPQLKKLQGHTAKESQIGVSLIDPPRNLWRGLTGADKDIALQNQWSTRSTVSGFTAWILGSILPDRNVDSNTEKSNAELWQQSPGSYIGKRLFQGIQIGNPDTKRQQIGLGVTAAGLFSAISGFNNIDLLTGKRFTNPAHAIGGLVTALSGANLLFANNERDGWKGFGSTLWLRLPLAGVGTWTKYTRNDRWGYYGAGQVTFQSAALYAYLFGGVEKLPDGTIIEKKDGNHGVPAKPETPALKPLFEEPTTSRAPSVHIPAEKESTPKTTVAAIEPSPDRLAEAPAKQLHA